MKAAVDSATADAQAKATNPRGSAWVSANAGSGKTFVLARRVVRLLLSGVDPARILCLTFTKAAASEMANRVFALLGRWTTLSDADLASEIADVEGAAPSPDKLAAARRLFARALDTPGGLKIQTIHAFCERLLHQFPFEANVAGHFEVLDERGAQALAIDARRAVLAKAAEQPDGPLGRALKEVLKRVSDRTHDDSLAQFVQRRDQIGAWITARGTIEGAIADLRSALGVRRGETVATLRARVIDEVAFDAADARRLLDLLQAGSKQDQSSAEALRPFVVSPDEDTRIDAYLDFYRKSDGDFADAEKIATKATAARWPGLTERFAAEIARLESLLDRIRTGDVFEGTVSMLALADAAIHEYQHRKRSRGALDFEDLVVRTVHLLARRDASAWVHYKLDRGLDHILVDEAQDTSPRQWQVIERLAQEFFAGEGASAAQRTLFAVGDEKQSIYSFQGAIPAWFARSQHLFAAAAHGGGYAWEDVELHLSFRSAPVILDAVDAVFDDVANHTGLTAEPRATLHSPIRRNDPGRVILWPAIRPPDKPETEDWIKPVDYLGEKSPEVMLARRIAATVADWLARGETLDAPDKDGNTRPIRPGGILVLVRYRGALADAIIRELKGKGIPIAGADRLTLTEHISVMDLMALGRVVLLPEDDLSLAALLKSPLIGLDEQALYDLAAGRRGTLWDALGARSAEREDFARAKARLDDWRAEADWRDPHAFYARILGSDGGRRAFLRRLGPEADDILDEFLAQAVAYGESNIPTLEGFLSWLVEGEAEVKRDTDIVRDEVRVMTVHGAKGLEADVVFLVDNGTAPHVAMHDARLMSLRSEHAPDDPGPFVWMRSIKHMPDTVRAVVEAWRERAREEYRRLLYVGMTRARDRLYLVGIDKLKLKEDRRWHRLVSDALAPELTPIESVDCSEASEWRARGLPAGIVGQTVAAEVDTTLPEWAARAAVAPPPGLRRITPSTIIADTDEAVRPFRDAFLAPENAASGMALQRGRLAHRLLQSLPDIAPEKRATIGAEYLAAFAPDKESWSDADRAALLAEVLAVTDDPIFAEAFAPGSRAEVDIAGRFEGASGPAAVSGRIDRLGVTEARVLIVDYKTNRVAPATLTGVPPVYLAQLALYRAVLRRLYPGKIVAAALVWTSGPSLMEIPADMLNQAESELARR